MPYLIRVVGLELFIRFMVQSVKKSVFGSEHWKLDIYKMCSFVNFIIPLLVRFQFQIGSLVCN